MRNKPFLTKEKINRQGTSIIILGLIAWLVLMINLNVF